MRNNQKLIENQAFNESNIFLVALMQVAFFEQKMSLVGKFRSSILEHTLKARFCMSVCFILKEQ